jgi:capsular polysaccharide biosynthesis protein
MDEVSLLMGQVSLLMGQVSLLMGEVSRPSPAELRLDRETLYLSVQDRRRRRTIGATHLKVRCTSKNHRGKSMELRQYWHIVWKRVWVVAALLIIVGAVSLLTYQPPPTTYQATMRFTVGILPEERPANEYGYDFYYTWVTSEYLADDLAQVVGGGAFAQAVRDQMAAAGDPSPINPAGSISGSAEHRILTVTVTRTGGDKAADQVARIAQAAVAVLQERAGTFFGQVDHNAAAADLTLADPPVVVPLPPGLTARLDLPLRLGLALLAGVALAFLLDYLDTTVRDRAELEALGLPVLGEIPARRQKWPRLK